VPFFSITRWESNGTSITSKEFCSAAICDGAAEAEPLRAGGWGHFRFDVDLNFHGPRRCGGTQPAGLGMGSLTRPVPPQVGQSISRGGAGAGRLSRRSGTFPVPPHSGQGINFGSSMTVGLLCGAWVSTSGCIPFRSEAMIAGPVGRGAADEHHGVCSSPATTCLNTKPCLTSSAHARSNRPAASI
jgi:hypothetical protein